MKSGTVLPKSITLFPRIDLKKDRTSTQEDDDLKPGIPAIKPEITFEDFGRIDLRVATVIHARTIPRAKKLLELEVDMGKKRTIVAGIFESYTPEDLVGKQVVIVANLKPAKLMGVLSEGMLIAAVDDSGCTVATPDKKVKPGTPLS